MKLELLMAVVHNEKVAYYSSIIQSHQANIQFSMAAKGTTHLVLSYLGITEEPKTLLLSVVRADEAPKLIEQLEETFNGIRVILMRTRGLDSFYAERRGLIVGF